VRDADAGPDAQDAPVGDDDLAQRALGPADQILDRRSRVEPGAQDRELVAAEPGDGVAGADDVVQPVRRIGEELVAGLVPCLVVDALEAVEVRAAP
jgi:hypothetical protein